MSEEDRKKATPSVGYGRPPEASRYRKGMSGNPSGRPKKAKSFEELAHDKMSTKVTVTLDGKRKRIALREVLVHEAMKAALKGDRHSRKLMLEADAIRHAQIAAEGRATAHELALDEEALEDYIKRFSASGSEEG